MAYKHSKGARKFDDITAENDSDGDTKIDFDEDYIALKTNGNNVLVVSGSNVGIGVATPDSTLHIAGNIHISGSNQEGIRIAKGATDYRQIVFETDGTDSANIHLSNSENLVIMNETNGKDIQFWVDPSSASSTQAMVIKESGKIGIGTDAPDYTLDVAGDIGINQYIYHNGDANTWINFTDNRIRLNAGGNNFIDCEDPGSAPHKVRINNGGNNIDFVIKDNSNNVYFTADASTSRIGIATATPIAELDVAGKIAITAEVSTPSQPSDGQGYLYTKSDGKLYWRSYDVAETDLTQAGGGGGGNNLSATSPKTGNYTASNWDFVLVNLVGASNDVTITLPAASSNAQIGVKISSLAMGKIVTVDGNASETIDGSTTKTMDSDYESIHLISDGNAWWRIS